MEVVVVELVVPGASVLGRPALVVEGLLPYVGQSVGEVAHAVRLVRCHGRGAEVDEQAPAVAQRAALLLQHTEHLLVGQRAGALHGQQLVAAAAVVGQVAAVAAAERAQLTLVGLLPRVGAHMGLQVALVGGGKRAQVAAVRLLP